MKYSSQDHSQYYRMLTRSMVAIVIIVSFTPLILISGTILFQFQSSHHEKVVAHLEELVEKHQQNIDSFLNEKLSEIRFLASFFTYEQLSDEQFLQEALNTLQAEFGGVFVDLGVINQDGLQIAYAGPFKLAKARYADADWFKEAMQSNYFTSDVFLGLRGLPHFIVAVRHEREGMNWILRATIDFMAFNNLVESIRIGKTGTAFIVNEAGEFQTKPRTGEVLEKEFYLELASEKPGERVFFVTDDFTGVSSPTWLPRSGESKVSVVERSDETGTPYVFVMTPLKEGDWTLFYQQRAEEAFSDLYHTQKIALLIFLLGGLGIIAMAFVLSRRMVRHIEKADMEKEMMNEQVIEAGKLASVGELAAGIAHEINNPVAIMVEEAGWIEDLLEEEDFRGGENLEEFRRALKQIKVQGLRCKEITHKLLSFARKTDPKAHDIAINDLIEEVVGLSEQRARYSSVKIKHSLGENLPLVTVSPSEMQQVFLNLINNALDAMEKSGGTLEITTRVDGGSVVVDVADTGPGIPKANLTRIFDPFFTTKPVGKGTGLGLAICYGIIKKAGGDISVNSAVGMGTTFHVYIPVSRSALSDDGTESRATAVDVA